jgi:hypothetical protein
VSVAGVTGNGAAEGATCQSAYPRTARAACPRTLQNRRHIFPPMGVVEVDSHVDFPTLACVIDSENNAGVGLFGRN